MSGESRLSSIVVRARGAVGAIGHLEVCDVRARECAGDGPASGAARDCAASKSKSKSKRRDHHGQNLNENRERTEMPNEAQAARDESSVELGCRE